MLRRRTKRNIPLPWEGKLGFVREALSGRRWKVLLAIGLSMVVVFTVYRVLDRQARTRATYAAIYKVKQTIYTYQILHNTCPNSLVALFDSEHTTGREYFGIPVDGWGHELQIICPSPRDPLGAEVFSAGPDGSFFGNDNIY